MALLGTPKYIDQNRDYNIDDDVQLVCKYLRVYENEKIDDLCGIQGKYIKHKIDELCDVLGIFCFLIHQEMK